MKYFINYPEDKGTKYELFKYPAGETQVRLTKMALKELEDASEIIVIARVSDGDSLIGLGLLTDALSGDVEFTKRTLILPYLPYSRADRRFTDGDCHGLKFFGQFIDNLAYDSVLTVDVHSNRAKKFISNLTCLSPISIIKTVYELLPKDTNILLPDEGAKRYELEKHFDPKKVFYCEKERDPVTGKLLDFKVPKGVEDNILIVDDICDGGGTFNGIASKFITLEGLYLYVTHGIFSKGFADLNKNFQHIYTTDSIGKKWNNLEEINTTIIPIQGLINSHILTRDEIARKALEAEKISNANINKFLEEDARAKI